MNARPAPPPSPAHAARPVTIGALVAYFLKLGATGFGGPIALAGAMHQSLVEERGWITPQEYLDGLALAQLAPGPLAAQLAIYCGFLRGGTLGATLVAVAFILPSFLIVWAISAAYVAYGGLAWMLALFFGVGAGVIAIIARSALKLARLTLRDSRLRWIIFVIMAAATAWTEREIAWLFLMAGIVPAIRAAWTHGRPPPAVTIAAVLPPVAASTSVTTGAQLFVYFAKAGAFVFGSGLAIVPFLYGGVVHEHHWLTDRQFLDAVAVAMITPGPVVITVAFIGYLVAGTVGMCAAAAGVFLPVYLFVIIPAPYFVRIKGHPVIAAFVEGVTAAAAGAIAGACVVLARRAFVDVWAVAIGVISFVVLSRWKVSDLWIIAGAGAAGLVLR